MHSTYYYQYLFFQLHPVNLIVFYLHVTYLFIFTACTIDILASFLQFIPDVIYNIYTAANEGNRQMASKEPDIWKSAQQSNNSLAPGVNPPPYRRKIYC